MQRGSGMTGTTDLHSMLRHGSHSKLTCVCMTWWQLQGGCRQRRAPKAEKITTWYIAAMPEACYRDCLRTDYARVLYTRTQWRGEAILSERLAETSAERDGYCGCSHKFSQQGDDPSAY